MKYKLIHNKTKEETICDMVSVDERDYYVSVEKVVGGTFQSLKLNFPKLSPSELDFYVYDKKDNKIYKANYESNYFILDRHFLLIATNNTYIDVPKVVDEVERLAEKFVVDKLKKSSQAVGVLIGFIEGYNKHKETHPYSAEDMIEFTKWCSLEGWKCIDYADYLWDKDDKANWKTTAQLLQIWEEQKIKTIYYE